MDERSWAPPPRLGGAVTYQVTAKRWEHGWELHIAGVGVTQADTLDTAEKAARDYLAVDLAGQPEDYNVTVTPEGGCTCDDEWVDCDVHVQCDEDCRAPQRPTTSEEFEAAWRHWYSHEVTGGCSHGR